MSVNIVNQTTGELTQVAGNATDKVGNLSALTTTDKSSCVGAINEVKSGLTNLETAQSCKFYGAYPNGSAGGNALVTIPVWNPKNLTPVVIEAYVYDSSQSFVEITNSISVWQSSKAWVDVTIAFNSAHAGKLLRIDLLLSAT